MRCLKVTPEDSYALSVLRKEGGNGKKTDRSNAKLTRAHTTEPLTAADVCEEVAVLGKRCECLVVDQEMQVMMFATQCLCVCMYLCMCVTV
jgi:hypothetical protein